MQAVILHYRPTDGGRSQRRPLHTHRQSRELRKPEPARRPRGSGMRAPRGQLSGALPPTPSALPPSLNVVRAVLCFARAENGRRPPHRLRPSGWVGAREPRIPGGGAGRCKNHNLWC